MHAIDSESIDLANVMHTTLKKRSMNRMIYRSFVLCSFDRQSPAPACKSLALVRTSRTCSRLIMSLNTTILLRDGTLNLASRLRSRIESMVMSRAFHCIASQVCVCSLKPLPVDDAMSLLHISSSREVLRYEATRDRKKPKAGSEHRPHSQQHEPASAQSVN